MLLHFNVRGADRKKLVEAISNALGAKAKYLGVPSCAYQVGEYTVSRDGILSWNDLDDVEPGSLEQNSMVIEACKTAGFKPEEQETIEGEETGLNIEMPKEGFTELQLENLQKLIEAKTPLLKEAFNIEDLQVVITDERVSFPWFSADIPAEEATAYTSFITALCQMAKEAKRVTAKEKTVDNPKYAFRCFLLRLGFIGDEYKVTRKILLKDLTGSSAFKSGAKKGGEE